MNDKEQVDVIEATYQNHYRALSTLSRALMCYSSAPRTGIEYTDKDLILAFDQYKLAIKEDEVGL